MTYLQRRWQLFLVAFAAMLAGTMGALADVTDIDGVITAVDGYRTAAITVAIAILLFVIGRTVVKKLVK